MKKLNLIIGKRQIVIVTLVIILSFAAFLNWKFATGDQAVTVMDVSNKTEKKENENQKSNENENSPTYGEAELVNKTQQRNNYIKQAKLDRDSAYDEAIENNNKLISSNSLNQEEKSKVIDQSMQLTQRKTQQESIENQIKSKDFVEGCIAYIEDGKVNVVIKATDLNNKIPEIKDIVQTVTNFPASNITVTPIN